jgi:hypothetical protein
MEPGHFGNFSLAGNFHDPKDPNVSNLYETESAKSLAIPL